MMSNVVATGRNLQLDVLRGVAILLVFGRHLKLEQPEGVTGTIAALWYQIGWIGVDLFFVLSGFLIGGLLLSEHARNGRIDVVRFLVRRGMKIYPIFYLFMAYLFLIPAVKTFLRGGSVGETLSERWFDLWPNLVFLNNYFLHDAAGHTWSLAVEEHFYLILPLLLIALTSLKRIHWLLPICLAMALVCLGLRYLGVVMGSSLAERMAATHFRVDALFFGVGIRAVAEFHPAWFLAARQWRSALWLLGLVLWMPNLLIAPDNPWALTLGLTGTFVGSGAFLLAAYHTHAADFGHWRRSATLVAALLAWVGTFSYAIYVWHVTAFGILERELAGRIVHWAGAPSQLTWLVSVLVVCGGTILAGALASKMVERPVLRLRDRFFPSRSKSLSMAA